MNLKELEKKINVCQKCPLAKARTKVVPGEGNARAKVMFVGEGPGYHEDKSGQPFCGSAGKLLDELLASIKLARKDVFISNLVKCRPPNNRDPEQTEAETCTKLYLDKQIKLIKPKIIVTLGRHSLSYLLPEADNISTAHGRAFRKNNIIYLALYHPAAALHQPNLKQILMKDFQNLGKLINLKVKTKKSKPQLKTKKF